MNFTLYSVKNNDLPPMKVPLWILEGALRVQESRGRAPVSPLGSGGCGAWGQRRDKGESALWRIVMASYRSSIIRDSSLKLQAFSVEVAHWVSFD